MEVRAPDGTLVILDCGTGAHALGLALNGSGERPLRGHLLITHTHWDHIQGLPFFAPLSAAGNQWDIYAPGGLGQELERTLSGQMEYTYFPVTLDQLGATIRFHDLSEGSFAVGGVRVTAQYLNHPALTLGYRLEAGGATFVYSVDHEPHFQYRPDAPADACAWLVHQEDRRHVKFLAAADLIVHDAQYTLEEYPQKLGWGHTPTEWAVDYALAGGAARLALFHHDPLRDDAALDRLVEVCRERVAAVGAGLEVFAAAEGQVIELAVEAVAPGVPAGATSASLVPEKRTMLIADDDPTVVKLLTLTLEPMGFRLLTAGDGEMALRLARAERPALILLDWEMPGATGMEVTRALRAESDPGLRDVPIVLITGHKSAEETSLGFAAGVTDYLTKPFKPPHVRARVHTWLLRRGARGDG